jgi:hypothetical protein
LDPVPDPGLFAMEKNHIGTKVVEKINKIILKNNY